MILKYFFIISAFFLFTSCSSLQKLEETQSGGLQNPSSGPAWAKEELYVSESTLGASAHIEIREDQSPVQGLILADAKAQAYFKKQLSLKLAAWLVTLNKNEKITGTALQTFTDDLINNDLDAVLLIDKRFYDKKESRVNCYSLATLNAEELKQKILEKILKSFNDAKTLRDDLEKSWSQFLASLPMG